MIEVQSMMGLINNMLLSYIESEKSTEAKKEVLTLMGRKGDYESAAIYSETEWQQLFKNSTELLDLSNEDLQIQFGKYAGKQLAQTFTGYFENAQDARTLLKKVPDIHIEYPTLAGQPTAKLSVLKDTPHKLTFLYNSPNRLCLFLRTLVEFVLEYYNDGGHVEQDICVNKGNDYCVINIYFKP